MLEERVNDISLLFFENLAGYEEIFHFVSTRSGGFSSPPYDSLNLGFHVGDEPEVVLKNRKKFASALGVPLESFTFAEQVHDGRVVVVGEELKGRGAFGRDTAVKAADAMVTDVPGVCLTVLVADCVPLLFYHPEKKVVGVAHAGWRGTARLIAQSVLRVFVERFGCSPEGILVGLGPSIGPCCYEVGPDVASLFDGRFLKFRGGKTYLDLREANRAQLMEMGVPEGKVEVAEICTCCNHKFFFSARHSPRTGRFGVGIMLRP